MRVLSFSLDPKIAEPESIVATRSVRYGTLLDTYTVLVPSKIQKETELSKNVHVYCSGGSNKFLQLVRLYKTAKVLVEGNKYDVVTSQDTSFVGLLAFFLARKYHMGFEVQVHGFEKLGWLRKKIARFLFLHAGVVRVTSARLQSKLISTFKMPQERVHIVPIYVDVSSLGLGMLEEKPAFQKSRKQFLEAYGDRFNFLTVSRLVPVKNISLQLQAIEVLRASFPNVMLHIVGDGPEKESLQKEIVKRGIETHVVLHGAKRGRELGSFYKEADCFLLTSHSEGYGMVVIEAAHAALPVIMTDVGCAGEVIVDKESGLVIDQADVASLTEKMKIVLTEEDTRLSLGSNAKTTTQKLLDYDHILEKYLETWTYASRRPL